MSLKINVYGGDKESDEYKAACVLKEIIRRDIPESVDGEIVLFSSATLVGQAVKDVDLMLLGSLQNYRIDAFFYNSSVGEIKDKVEILSFCTTIEIKRHDISGIYVNGTDFYVKYGKGSHCVMVQSNKQKIAAMNFFQKTLSFSPYITNLIWFTQVTSGDVNGLLTNHGKKMPSNVLAADFKFKDLIQLLIYQKPPYRLNGKYYFDSNYNSNSVLEVERALELFSKTKEQMGELTRRRIEQITNQTFVNNQLIDSQGNVSIYRGRAGTGKTVGLIQTAIYLVEEKQERVLLLTYNKALVSDIRRLFALAEMPDMFEESCVCVDTMHSFFFALSNQVLYDGKMSGEKFIDNYNRIMKDLLIFLSDAEGVQLTKDIMECNAKLNWDYVLIDEAQDWTDIEKEVILRIFEKGKIIVADGGLQFVRNINPCDWSMIKERNSIKLKYCLRQKENLVSFLNAFTKESGILGGKILSNSNMLGGRVIVSAGKSIIDIHQQEAERLSKSGNIPYDMLYLVPHRLVSKSYGISEFSQKQLFEENGISVWDGTSNKDREVYSVRGDEIRVLQYNSARGLEGWTVVCLELDTFIEEKMAEYVEGNVDSLSLESPEERKQRYIYNWIMIPLTRAIDTIVITVKNKDSHIYKILKGIAVQYPDFVMLE